MCEKYLKENQFKSNSKYGHGHASFGSTVSLSPKAEEWFKKSKQSNSNEPLILEMSAELLSLEEHVVIQKLKLAPASPVKKLVQFRYFCCGSFIWQKCSLFVSRNDTLFLILFGGFPFLIVQD